MLKSSYDVVIVGTDLPALVFGALAAKKGYRILVLGHGGKENIYEYEGFRFVRRPGLLYGFADSHPLREVFRELALAPEMRNLPRPLAPTCNLVLPDARIELTHLKGVLEEEIAREFPGRVDAFRDFSRRLIEAEATIEPLLRDCPILPPATIGEYFTYRKYRKLVRSLLDTAWEPFPDDAGLAAFFMAPLSAMSGISEPWKHGLPFVRLANHLLRGLFFVEWGMDALKTLFLERIKNNSGDVRLSDHVDTLLVRRGRVAEVEVRARDEAIGVNLLCVGTELGPVLDLIHESSAKRRYRARVERMQPTHYRVAINLGCRRVLVPEGMAQIAFLVRDPGKPMEGTNCLTLQVDPAMEPTDAVDPDKAVITVSGLMPAAEFNRSPATVEGFCRSMLEASRVLLPFLDLHLTAMHVPAVGSDPKTGEPVVDPTGLVPVYGSPVPRCLDVLTWPLRTGYKNVLFLGDAVSGSLGFEGAFMAAFMGFGLLRKAIELKSTIS